MKRTILTLIVGGIMVIGSSEAHAQQTSNANVLKRLFATDWDFRHREHPETATWQGDHRYDTKLTDLSPAAIERRKAHDRDRYERDLALLGRVRESYLRQAQRCQWHVLDASRERELVAGDVAAAVRRLLSDAAS